MHYKPVWLSLVAVLMCSCQREEDRPAPPAAGVPAATQASSAGEAGSAAARGAPPPGEPAPGEAAAAPAAPPALMQSGDVVAATDSVAAGVLALQPFNDPAKRPTLVVEPVVDKTSGAAGPSRFNPGIFGDRLRTQLSRKGRGRVRLMETEQRVRELGPPDDSGPPPEAKQPDFALRGAMHDPEREGGGPVLAFELIDRRTDKQVWSSRTELIPRE